MCNHNEHVAPAMFFLYCFSHSYAPRLYFKQRLPLPPMCSMDTIVTFLLMISRLNPGVLKHRYQASLHLLTPMDTTLSPVTQIVPDSSSLSICLFFTGSDQSPSLSPDPDPPEIPLTIYSYKWTSESHLPSWLIRYTRKY